MKFRVIENKRVVKEAEAEGPLKTGIDFLTTLGSALGIDTSVVGTLRGIKDAAKRFGQSLMAKAKDKKDYGTTQEQNRVINCVLKNYSKEIITPLLTQTIPDYDSPTGPNPENFVDHFRTVENYTSMALNAPTTIPREILICSNFNETKVGEIFQSLVDLWIKNQKFDKIESFLNQFATKYQPLTTVTDKWNLIDKEFVNMIYGDFIQFLRTVQTEAEGRSVSEVIKSSAGKNAIRELGNAGFDKTALQSLFVTASVPTGIVISGDYLAVYNIMKKHMGWLPTLPPAKNADYQANMKAFVNMM